MSTVDDAKKQWDRLVQAEREWLAKPDAGTAQAYVDAFKAVRIGSVGELLAEHQRMAAVVAAAREMSRVCDHAPELVPDVYFQWKALRQALAALEGGE